MSLDFNLTGIKDVNTTCFETVKKKPKGFDDIHHGGPTNWHYNKQDGVYQRMRNKTHTIIWSGLTTFVGRITKSNWEEAYHRIALYQLLTDAYDRKPVIKDGTERWVKDPITPEDVHNHVGYSSNTFGNKSDWNKSLKRMLERYTGEPLTEFFRKYDEERDKRELAMEAKEAVECQ